MEGLLEIAYVNIRKKNASTADSHLKMAKLVFDAQTDESVKCILFHGGPSFSSGNDISALAAGSGMDISEDEKWNKLAFGTQHSMTQFLTNLNRSVKPVVGLVRGVAMGIGATLTSMFDFIYCTPEATFSTPFMKSAQSPEGSSTYTFPQQFGMRRANEILLLDRPVTA
jgi:peroxisomal 3,2-trans-enoyl-CoA isomerase